MKHRRSPERVSDLAGGELVRVGAGLVRICPLAWTLTNGTRRRWARLHGADGREVPGAAGVLWLKPDDRVLEVVEEARTREHVADAEMDPLAVRR